MVTSLFTAYFDSPLGKIEISGTESRLRSLFFVEATKKPSPQLPASETIPEVLHQTIQFVQEYFKGTRKSFETLPLEVVGTDFQKRVWNELTTIPYGKTITYLQLAKQLGDPKCIRAAATANGNNPLSIIVPCHRVIGSDGTLVGYGGDVWRKKALLDLEQKQIGAFGELF